MVDDTGRIDESRMWQAVERLETASQATREEQVAMNARLDTLTLRMDRLFYAIIGGTITVAAAVVIHGFLSG